MPTTYNSSWFDDVGRAGDDTFSREWVATHQVYRFYLLDGNDTVHITTEAIVWGGEGADSIDASGANDAVSLYGDNGINTIRGSNYDDFIEGGVESDDLDGMGGQDQIYGSAGQDNIWGGGGDDDLYGGAGNDVIRGGDGIDRMSGDDGDDNYEVTEQQDRVLEHAADGHDTIYSDISFTISANVEDMILFGGDDVNATGNGLGNGIRGNAGNNVLKGMGGGDNLYGAAGRDKLDGGAGKDFFSFAELGSENADRIVNFNHKDDTVFLERDVFSGITTSDMWTKLKTSQYAENKDGKAKDGNDRILYDTTDGKLYWDPDGKGGADRVHFATIDKHPASLSADDFLIV